jgi:hypothetical protein
MPVSRALGLITTKNGVTKVRGLYFCHNLYLLMLGLTVVIVAVIVQLIAQGKPVFRPFTDLFSLGFNILVPVWLALFAYWTACHARRFLKPIFLISNRRAWVRGTNAKWGFRRGELSVWIWTASNYSQNVYQPRDWAKQRMPHVKSTWHDNGSIWIFSVGGFDEFVRHGWFTDEYREEFNRKADG